MTIDRKQIAMGGLLLLVVLSLPLILVNGYQLRLVNFVGINILLVLGLNFVLGYAGLLSFAQVGFFLIGAYTGGILSSDYGISFWLALPLAAIASGLCAWLVGVPTLRLRGHYFTFATFAFAETVRLIALNLELTHGASGLVGIPAPRAWSFSIDSDASFFYLILVFVIDVNAAIRPKPPLIGTVIPELIPNVIASSRNLRCSRVPAGLGAPPPQLNTSCSRRARRTTGSSP